MARGNKSDALILLGFLLGSIVSGLILVALGEGVSNQIRLLIGLASPVAGLILGYVLALMVKQENGKGSSGNTRK